MDKSALWKPLSIRSFWNSIGFYLPVTLLFPNRTRIRFHRSLWIFLIGCSFLPVLDFDTSQFHFFAFILVPFHHCGFHFHNLDRQPRVLAAENRAVTMPREASSSRGRLFSFDHEIFKTRLRYNLTAMLLSDPGYNSRNPNNLLHRLGRRRLDQLLPTRFARAGVLSDTYLAPPQLV